MKLAIFPFMNMNLCANGRQVVNVGLLSFVTSWLSVLSPIPANAQDSGTLGFVIRDWFISNHSSTFKDECPNGLATPNSEIWLRRLSKDNYKKLYQEGWIPLPRGGSGFARRRGPQKEEVCFWPEIVKDPPMKIIEGKYAFGANLDDNTDGTATPKTCAHENFTGIDGTPGVDNQLYRLVGCNFGWQPGGNVEVNANERRGTSGLGMILVEITGVTDPRNSDDVTVTFYRSVDQYAFDGTGRPVPFSSYRIHTHPDGTPVYGDSLNGYIEDGVLTTERGHVFLPYYGSLNFYDNVVRDMALTLKITPDGATAKGQITGYYDLKDYVYYEGGMGAHTSAGDSCPAFWDMAQKLADGYPDPKTGECTYLSSSFDIGAYAAFIIHPPEENRKEKKTALGMNSK